MFGGYLESGTHINGLLHPPGLRGAVSSLNNNVPKMMQHWTDGRYLEIYNSCFLMVKELAPTVGGGSRVCTRDRRMSNAQPETHHLVPPGSRRLAGPSTTVGRCAMEVPSVS